MGGHTGPPLCSPQSDTTSRHHCAPHLNLVLHTLVVRMQLADANWTLGGLRTLIEMALAEELTRQNGAPEKRLGDRQMEGLAMAALSLMVMASELVQRQRQRWEPLPASPRSRAQGVSP